MKAVVFHGVERLSVDEVTDPCLACDDDVIVAVDAAGLCGSDLHPWAGREQGLDVGTVMGHEFVGRVVEVGPAVTTLAAGDRVVAPFTTSCGQCAYCTRGLTARCLRGQLFGWRQDGEGLHGAQASHVRVPLADGTLVRVPDVLDDDAVALLAGDILATALFGATLAQVRSGDSVAVVGCGPVGLLAIRAAVERGAAKVFAADPVPSRREAAVRFGAIPLSLDAAGRLTSEARATLLDATGGLGADAAIEAVGGAGATRTAAALVRLGGRIAAVGVHTEPHLALSPGELYDRNLTYAAGRCPARAFLPEALSLAARDRTLLAGLVTHRLPLDAAPDAYVRFATREPGMNKVVFIP